jgi:hypothetical protein
VSRWGDNNTRASGLQRTVPGDLRYLPRNSAVLLKYYRRSAWKLLGNSGGILTRIILIRAIPQYFYIAMECAVGY